MLCNFSFLRGEISIKSKSGGRLFYFTLFLKNFQVSSFLEHFLEIKINKLVALLWMFVDYSCRSTNTSLNEKLWDGSFQQLILVYMSFIFSVPNLKVLSLHVHSWWPSKMFVDDLLMSVHVFFFWYAHGSTLLLTRLLIQRNSIFLLLEYVRH